MNELNKKGEGAWDRARQCSVNKGQENSVNSQMKKDQKNKKE